MRKEVILAIIIGVLLGGIILFGINLANKASKLNSGGENVENTNENSSPSIVKKSPDLVSIIFPQANAVVTESVLTLKGSAKPNSTVAIISENDDILATIDSSGNFSSLINLISGENMITVTVVDENQATASSTITVIRTNTIPE